MNKVVSGYAANRRYRWLWAGLLAQMGAPIAQAQIWDCAADGGSAQCPEPDKTDFSCLGTFSIGDSQPCAGLGFPGPRCGTEGEALEQAIANYSEVPPGPCTKPSYGPLCPAAWNPHQVEYTLGVLSFERHAYVANIPSLIDGQCTVTPFSSCGNVNASNGFFGAIGNCVRGVTCPAGTVPDGGVCKVARSKVCPLGNPMDCVTGEKTQVEQDVRRSDASPLEFTRYYSSSGFYEPRGTGPQSVDDPHLRILGPNWRHTYQREIRPEPPVVGQPAMMTVMRPNGDYLHFRLVGGQWVGGKDEPDTLHEIVELAQRVGWRLQTADNTVEIYDANGRLQSLSYPTGQILTMQYSTSATSPTIAPTGGLLIEVADSNDRTLQLRYDALARIATIVDPGGGEYDYAYTANHALTGVTHPDTTTRTYLYNEPAHNLNYYAGTLLTGIVDENGQRYGTYRYSHNRVNDEWHGSANADRMTITYSSGASPPFDFARSTGPLGNFEQRDFIFINDAVKEKGRKRCVTQNCSTLIAQSSNTYDANGNLATTTDYRGTLTDYDFNDRGQELVRRENFVEPVGCPAPSTFYASNFGSSCTTGTCWATSPFPGSSSGAPLGWGTWHYSCLQATGPVTQTRSIETDWHPTFNLPTERRVRNASNALESRTQWVYNGRGQISARCEVDVTDPATAAHACSASTVPPPSVRVRRWVHAYCEAADVAASNSTCPILGLAKSVNGPRAATDPGMNGADDLTTYFYYASTNESGCGSFAGPCHRKGDLQFIVDALGHATENVSYDRGGRVRRSKDANGTLTDTAYDDRGRTLSTTVRALANGSADAGDATTSFIYDGAGQVTRVTQPDGAYQQFIYDDAHRLTDVIDNLGNRIRYTLDSAGNRIKEETYDATYNAGAPGVGLKRSMSRVYNQLDKLTKKLNAGGATKRDSTTYDSGGLYDGYDGNGNFSRFVNGRGVQTKLEYDPLDRLTKTIYDYLGTSVETADATTTYTYDTRDNPRTVTDPSGLTTTYTYDGLGQYTAIDSPDTGHSAYDYDLAGNRVGQTDNRGVTSTYAYDALNRMTGIAYPDGDLDVAFAYDQADVETGCPGSFPIGRLTRMTDASGSTTYCYDRRGNVTTKTQVTSGKTLAVNYAYDRADRLVTLVYPSGAIAIYTRDLVGRVVSLSWKSDANAVPIVVVDSATYLPFGPANVLTFGNGRTLTKTYDADYVIDRIVSSASDGLVLDFTADVMGNIVAASDTVGAATPARRYVYDNLSRVTRVDDGSNVMLEDYAYNKTGDRTLKQFAGQAVQVYTYLAGTHRLGSVDGAARTYDGKGNTTDRGNGAA